MKDNIYSIFPYPSGLVASYDPKTDKIEGCNIYTKAWWHERGHQVLNNKPSWKAISLYWTDWLIIYSIVFLCFNSKIGAIVCISTYMLIQFIDELYAWKYCYDHKAEWKK